MAFATFESILVMVLQCLAQLFKIRKKAKNEKHFMGFPQSSFYFSVVKNILDQVNITAELSL